MAEQPPNFQSKTSPSTKPAAWAESLAWSPCSTTRCARRFSRRSSEAVRIHLGPEITPQRMKNYICRMARDLNVPVTVRRMPGGVIFWRSSEEDLQQAQETASRLQTGRRPQTRPEGARRGEPAKGKVTSS